MDQDTSFDSPTKKRMKSKPVTENDQFQEEAIRRMIYNFHITEKERITLGKLHRKMVRELDFKGSVASYRRIVRRLGFQWRRTKDNRKILIEKHDICFKCLDYLRKVRQYRREDRPIVYID